MSPDPVPVPPAVAAARWAHRVPDRLPAAALALAGSCLVGQLVQLAVSGTRPPDAGWVPSMLLGALLVGWVASGVLRARTGRLVVAWVLFVLSVLGDAASLLDAGYAGLVGWPAAQLLTSLAALLSLLWFTTTPYYAWQRTRPRVPGPSIAAIVAVAVAVGVLGGTLDVEKSRDPVHVRFGDG